MDYINTIKESPISMIGVGGVVGSFNFYSAAADYSVDFDGNDQLILASDAVLSPSDQDFTFEVWLYPDAAWGGSFDSIYFNNQGTGGFWLGAYQGDWVVRTGGTTNHITIDPAPTVGEWTQVVVARESGTLYVWYNGAQKGNVSNSTNWPTAQTLIGNDGGGSTYNGYMSNLRFVKGTNVYGTNHFSPPSSPLTNVTNTKLLCCQSSSSVTTAAVAPGSITTSGDPTASTSQYTFPFYSNGGYAVQFDGATDGDALTVADFPNFLTNNFTVECYIMPDNVSGGIDTIMDNYQNSSSSGAWWALHQNNDGFYWGRNSANPISTSGNLSNSTWYHVAMVRNGTNFTLYLNGSSIGTYTESYDYTDGGGSETRTLSIGRQHNPGSGRQYDGKISNVRITIGQALYTSNFTSPIPAISPLTNSSQGAISDNVKLLCCGQSTTTGSAVTSGTITAISSPSVVGGPF